MSWEYIAEPFSGRWPEEPEWIEFQVKIAIRYLKLICGNPPAGCRLDLTMREHELGDYPKSLRRCWIYMIFLLYLAYYQSTMPKNI